MHRFYISNGNGLKNLFCYLCCIFMVILTSGCGDEDSQGAKPQGNTADATRTGSASFSVQWRPTADVRYTQNRPVRTAIEDCNTVGVESITCEVYDEANQRIAGGGPWSCDDHGARMERIPAGPGRTFAIFGWSAETDGEIVYRGISASGIDIRPGEIADAGTILAEPFVPNLNSPADGQSIAAHALVLTWHEMPNAQRYRVLVANDTSFEAPVVNEVTTETTHTPANLPEATTYYWFVRALDSHGNESGVSETRHFITDTTPTDDCLSPALSPIGNRQVAEGNLLTFTLSANDPDSSALSYSHSSLPNGATFDSNTQTFNWTPGQGDAGNYSVNFTVCDDCASGPKCDAEEITITVGDVCRPPVLSSIGSRQVAEGQPLTFTLGASDPDGGALTYSHTSLPNGATYDANTRTFSWTPGYGDVGNYRVTFTVCDDCPDGAQCDAEEVAITVGDVCRPPVLGTIGNRQVAEGGSLAFTISASDPDGGTLTYSHGNLPGNATFNANTQEFNWTPSFGDAGNYPVTFTVCDDCPDGAQCVSENINITVGDVCRPPVLSTIGNRQVAEGGNLRFTVSASDPDGGTLTYSHGNLPGDATFNTNTREFNWTPGFGDAGNYPVTFTVCDDCPGGQQCVSENINITVGDVCRPPVLSTIGNRQISEGGNLRFTVSASDPDGGTLTYSHGNLPGDATFNTNTRVFDWTPDFGDAGNYPVTFTVCDDCPGGQQCVSENINITVGDVCRPPVLSHIGNRQVTEGSNLRFTVSASDPDGGTLTYSHTNLPGSATFNTNTREFNWTPAIGDAGNYPLTFTVCDDCPGGQQCVSENINITVGSACRPPVLSSIGNQQVAQGSNLRFTLSASDPDGGTLIYSHTNLPSGATLNPNTGAFSWTPTGYGEVGEHRTIFSVCDDCSHGAQCDSEEIRFTVTHNPQPCTPDFSITIGDNDGYGYGHTVVPDFAYLPSHDDQVGYEWIFDNQSQSEKMALNGAQYTDVQRNYGGAIQFELTIYTCEVDPQTFRSAYLDIDLSGIQSSWYGKPSLTIDGVDFSRTIDFEEMGSFSSDIKGFNIYPDNVSMFSDNKIVIQFNGGSGGEYPIADAIAFDFFKFRINHR